MKRISRSIAGWLLLILIAASCTQYQKLRKSDDWSAKYAAAVEYYENQDYFRASGLFEDILPVIRGTEEAELANFYYAYSYFHQKQYILSAHYFQTFAEVYGRSEYAMEAEYMHAFSLYMQSPDYNLDQTATLEAISAMQEFVNKYPYTDFATPANEYIGELQAKLERKDFENAKLYFKVKRYEAAIVAFDNFRIEFPGSSYQEEAMFLGIKTAHAYAKVSIRSRQEERYQVATDKYITFVDKYPESEFLKEAETIYADCTEVLTKFASRNNN